MVESNYRDGERPATGAVGHVRSYYAATAGKLTYYPPPDSDRTCGTCVIGGGLAGLATAMYLAQAGHDVTLVEARRLAWGASGRNGGFVSPGFAESIFNVEKRLGLQHSQALYRASVEGMGAIRNIIRESGKNAIIGGNGWLKMIRHGRTDEVERRAERMARDYNTNLEFLDRRALRDHVSTDTYQAGLLDMAPFHVQPLELAALFAARAVAAGARLHENSRALSVERDGKEWVVKLDDSKLNAEQVVLATSVYGGPSQKVNAAMIPVATYVVTASSQNLEDAIRFTGCLGDTRRASDYYRLVGAGSSRQLLWGGRITTEKSEPRDLASTLLHDVRGVYPQLNDLEVGFAWSGLMGYALHKMPIIGRLDKGLWTATAFGGHGLNTAVMAGALLADAISGRDDRIKLFEPFGPVWAGGSAGRIGIQIEYWRLQFLDWVHENLTRRGH